MNIHVTSCRILVEYLTCLLSQCFLRTCWGFSSYTVYVSYYLSKILKVLEHSWPWEDWTRLTERAWDLEPEEVVPRTSRWSSVGRGLPDLWILICCAIAIPWLSVARFLGWRLRWMGFSSSAQKHSWQGEVALGRCSGVYLQFPVDEEK